MRLLRSAFAVLVFLAAAPSFAAVHIWTGGSSERMSDAGNWTGGSPAGDRAAELVFPAGVARLEVVNDLADLTVASLSLSGIGYAISGNPITLANAQVSDSTHGPNAMANDLILSGDAWFVVGGTFLPESGLTLSGQIRGTGSLVKFGRGVLIFSGTAPNTFAGDTRLREGQLRLAKPAGVNAVPGDVFVETTSANNENGVLFTAADEQVPDQARISVSSGSTAIFSGFETIGPLVVHGGGRVETHSALNGNWVTNPGTLVINNGITVLPHRFDAEAEITGSIVIPDLRVITANGALRLGTVRGPSATAGLIVRSSRGSQVKLSGTYEGPTIVEGASVTLDNARSAATLRDGKLSGTAKSVHAERGEVSLLASKGDLRLDSGVTLFHRDETVPALTASGTVTIAGAALKLDTNNFRRQLGKTFVLISNTASGPVNGSFAGLPEGAVYQDLMRISYRGGDGNDVVLTQVGKYTASISLSSPSVPAGQPVTIEARISSPDFAGPFTGTVVFRKGETVLATVPVAGATASTTVTLPPGVHKITASYSGNEQVAPAEASFNLGVLPPKPTITAIEPGTVVAGTQSTLVIRGTDFLPGARVTIDSNGYLATFVSPAELRLDWEVPPYESDRTLTVDVTQPEPGNVRSNPASLRVTGAAPQPSELTFDASGVEGRVTPGASGLFFFNVQRGSNRFEFGSAIVADSDNNGSVRFPMANPLQTFGTFALVDMTAGTILAGTPSGRRPRSARFPAKAFLRDAPGHYSYLVMPAFPWESFVLVRPGAGAWEAQRFGNGGSLDLDQSFNDVVVFNVSAMTPVGASPAPPAGVLPGDVFLGMNRDGQFWFGERIDQQLTETIGPGVIALTRTTSSLAETAGVVRITLLRTEGTDGVVSVRYATADDTARAGTNYLPDAGTVTFGPGEILKTIEIAVVDDAFHFGNTAFRVVLSDPAGATIKGPATHTVTIQEDDRAPVLSVSSAEVREGDEPGSPVALDVTLTGASGTPLTATWGWTEDPFTSTVRPAGTLVFQPGETRKSITVPVDGNTIPNAARTVRVIVSYNGTSAGGVIRIIDDDVATVTIADASMRESNLDVWVPVRTNVTSERPVVVSYRTVDGTATAGVDYTATAGTVEISRPSSASPIIIPIRDDGDREGDEWFLIELTEAAEGVLRRSRAVVTIVDDEAAVMPVLTGADKLSGETDNAHVLFYLSAPAAADVTFRVTTANGTAVAGNDYVAVDRQLTIRKGETTAVASIPIISDNSVEGTESFRVLVSEVNGARALATSYDVIIFDNDNNERPVLTMSDVQVQEGRSGTTPVTFVLKLSRLTGLRVVVRYSTRNETATAPPDYVPAAGEVVFEPSETSKTVTVMVNGDTTAERDEKFQLVLHSTDATLDGGMARCTIVNDDGPPEPKRRSTR